MTEYVLTKKKTCPNCHGQKTITKVDPAGSTANTFTRIPCMTCDATGIIRTEIELSEAIKQLSLKGAV